MKVAARKALSGRGLLLVTAVAAGALAGAAGAVFATGDHDCEQPVGPRITAEQAADAALTRVPGGYIEGLEVAYDGRILRWEADVLARDGAWRELHIDARDGRVFADHIDHPEGSGDGDGRQDASDGPWGLAAQATALRSAKTTALRAVRAALAAVPGTMTEVDFEYRRPAYVWEVNITANNGHEHRLRVDTASDKVTTAWTG